MASEPTVYVVEDNHVVRDSLRTLIEAAGLSVETYESAEAFLADYDSENRGCLVLDLRLPGAGGLELQEALANKGIALPIIMITAYGDVQTTALAMRRGAVDVLQKPFAHEDLLARIREATMLDRLRRRAYAKRASLAERLARLTSREREVLDLLLEGKTTKAIAQALDLSPRTIDGHRRHVLAKMQVCSAAELLPLFVAEGKPV